MCNPAVIPYVIMAVGAVMKTNAEYQQAKTDKAVAKSNAKIAGYQAEDAHRRGEEEAMKVRRQAMALKSAQRAGFGGKGVDVGYGTAFDIQEQTDFFGEADVQTTRYNAAIEAWGHRARQQQFKAQAQGIHPQMQAAGTLLGQAGSIWSGGKTAGAF